MTESSPELTFERVFASPSLNGPAPRAVKFSPDGKYLTLLRNRDDDRERYDLWGYDIETSAWSMLVDSEKCMRYSNGRTWVVGIMISLNWITLAHSLATR